MPEKESELFNIEELKRAQAEHEEELEQEAKEKEEKTQRAQEVKAKKATREELINDAKKAGEELATVKQGREGVSEEEAKKLEEQFETTMQKQSELTRFKNDLLIRLEEINRIIEGKSEKEISPAIKDAIGSIKVKLEHTQKEIEGIQDELGSLTQKVTKHKGIEAKYKDIQKRLDHLNIEIAVFESDPLVIEALMEEAEAEEKIRTDFVGKTLEQTLMSRLYGQPKDLGERKKLIHELAQTFLSDEFKRLEIDSIKDDQERFKQMSEYVTGLKIGLQENQQGIWQIKDRLITNNRDINDQKRYEKLWPGITMGYFFRTLLGGGPSGTSDSVFVLQHQFEDPRYKITGTQTYTKDAREKIHGVLSAHLNTLNKLKAHVDAEWDPVANTSTNIWFSNQYNNEIRQPPFHNSFSGKLQEVGFNAYGKAILPNEWANDPTRKRDKDSLEKLYDRTLGTALKSVNVEKQKLYEAKQKEIDYYDKAIRAVEEKIRKIQEDQERSKAEVARIDAEQYKLGQELDPIRRKIETLNRALENLDHEILYLGRFSLKKGKLQKEQGEKKAELVKLEKEKAPLQKKYEGLYDKRVEAYKRSKAEVPQDLLKTLRELEQKREALVKPK